MAIYFNIFFICLFLNAAMQDQGTGNRKIMYKDSTQPSIAFYPIWPTLENGDMLLQPRKCTEQLGNCSSRGICAEHHTGIVCFCLGNSYGKICENTHANVPAWLVFGSLSSVVVTYGVVLRISICTKAKRLSEQNAIRNLTKMSTTNHPTREYYPIVPIVQTPTTAVVNEEIGNSYLNVQGSISLQQNYQSFS